MRVATVFVEAGGLLALEGRLSSFQLRSRPYRDRDYHNREQGRV